MAEVNGKYHLVNVSDIIGSFDHLDKAVAGFAQASNSGKNNVVLLKAVTWRTVVEEIPENQPGGSPQTAITAPGGPAEPKVTAKPA